MRITAASRNAIDNAGDVRNGATTRVKGDFTSAG
jgi:hypothetical protein